MTISKSLEDPVERMSVQLQLVDCFAPSLIGSPTLLEICVSSDLTANSEGKVFHSCPVTSLRPVNNGAPGKNRTWLPLAARPSQPPQTTLDELILTRHPSIADQMQAEGGQASALWDPKRAWSREGRLEPALRSRTYDGGWASSPTRCCTCPARS